ncbi:MAG: hypothetical protein MJE66_16155 [Proteobacteria bacterium]|nr:hypothetical protein [Pseudomonadota bacterium]
MATWVLVCLCLLLLAAGAGVVHLAFRALQSRGAAERGLTLALAWCVLGFGGWVLAPVLGDRGLPGQAPVSWAAETLIAIGVATLVVGTWRVYRPDARWAAGLSLTLVGATLLALLAAVASGEVLEPSGSAIPVRVLAAARVLCFAWWGTESLLYGAKVRRRVALGLADAQVAERLRWMGWGAVGVAVVLACTPLCGWLVGRPPREVPVLTAFMLASASASVASLYIGLFMPAFIARRLGLAASE